MISLKISELLNSTETLLKLSQKDFKAKLAWQIARILKAAEAEIQSFNETRTSLIKKYGEKDETGELVVDEKGNCKIGDTDLQEFNAQLTDLLNSDVEINANKIDIAQLENLDFTPSDMAILEPFVNMDE